MSRGIRSFGVVGLWALTVTFVLAGLGASSAAAAPPSQSRPGELIVRHTRALPATPAATTAAAAAGDGAGAAVGSAEDVLAPRTAQAFAAGASHPDSLRAVEARFGLVEARPLYTAGMLPPRRKIPAARRAAIPASAAGASDLWVLRFPPATDLAAARRALQNDLHVLYAEPNLVGGLAYVPSDPLYAATAGDLALIGMPAAWDVQPGANADTVVAILDSGVEATHRDLADALDLRASYNFVDSNSVIFDDRGHGTRVAGIVGAMGNNGEGMAGVAFGCTLISLDVANASGAVSSADVVSAIYWAMDQGASVINMSLRFTAPNQALEEACAYAAQEGIVLVAASGNENQGDAAVYPASYDTVIGVGATTDDGVTRASFSNYNGQETSIVDLVAPGTTVFSTIPGSQYNGSYGSGTSFAAPMVSGVAALLRAAHPEQSAHAIALHLQATATPLGAWAGAGRLNAAAALATPMAPSMRIVSVAVDDDPSYSAANDGNGVLDPGESARILVTLTSDDADATTVTAVLSTASPAVTSLGTATASYGRVGIGSSVANSAQPFGLVTVAAATAATSVDFALAVSAANPYATTLHFTAPIEHPVITGGTQTDAVFAAGATYHVTSDLLCAGTCTVQPGVRFEIDPGVRFDVGLGATFTASGTASQPIVFTSSRPFSFTGTSAATPGPAGFTGPRTEAVALGAYNHILYVAPAFGPAGGAGTAASPYSTLAAALAATSGASPSNRYAILVAQGLCTGNIDMLPYVDLYGGFEARGWTRDIFAHPSVLDGLNVGTVVTGADNARIDGFQITEGNTAGSGGGVVCNGVDGCRVTNNFFLENVSKLGGAAVSCADSSATIANNLIWSGSNTVLVEISGASASGQAFVARNIVGDGQKGGLVCDLGTEAVLDGNLVVQCTGGPAVLCNATSVTVRNNYILGNQDLSGATGAGTGIWVDQGSSPSLYGNVIQDNASHSASNSSPGITVVNSSSPSIFNNLIRGNICGGPGSGGIYADPGCMPRIGNCIVRGNQGNPTDVAGTDIADLSYCDLDQMWMGLGSLDIAQPEGTVGPIAWGVATGQSYDSTARVTHLTVAQGGLRAHALAGRPIKVESMTYAIQDNTADTILLYGALPTSLTARSAAVAGSQGVALAARPLRLRWSVEDFHLTAGSGCIGSGEGPDMDPRAAGWDMDHQVLSGSNGLDIGPDQYSARTAYAPWSLLDVSMVATAATFSHCIAENGAGVLLERDAPFDDCTVQRMAGCGLQFSGALTPRHSLTADGNLSTGIGAQGLTLTNCSASYNGADGVLAQSLTSCTAVANLGRGLVAGMATLCTADYNTSHGCVVMTSADRIAAHGNDGWGLVITDTAVTTGCLAFGNLAGGILDQGNSFGILGADTAILNGGTGISAPSMTGTISGCTSNYNGGFGIVGSGPPTVEGCRTIGNGEAGLTSGGYVTACFVVGNDAGVLYGETLENSYIAGNRTFGAVANAHAGPFLERCSVVGNGADGAQDFLGIDNCWIVGNGGSGLVNAASPGVPTGDATSCTVRNNGYAGIYNLSSLAGSNIYGNVVPRVTGLPHASGLPPDPTEALSTVISTGSELVFTGNYWGPAHTAELDGSALAPPFVTSFVRDSLSGSGSRILNLWPYSETPIANAPDVSVLLPFLVSVQPSPADSLNVGLTTFTLVYSQPMRTTADLSVTFANADPFTAHVVRPAPGWVSPTTWRGAFTIASDTGDGVQTIRVAEAYSQTGIWLPDDLTGRFTINTSTTGTLAANNGLASASGSTMDVSWSLDGLPAGAEGFNVSRSDSNTPGTFEIVNDSLISVSEIARGARSVHLASGLDYNDAKGLAPATTYWYVVSVVDAGSNSMQWTPPFSGTTNVWSVSAPTVVNRTASRQTATRATLGGTVSETGGEDPTVRIYWGTTDGEDQAANWDHVEDLGVRQFGDFSVQLTSLVAGTQYYYRCYAVNSHGESWAPDTIAFQAVSGLPAPTGVSATDGTLADRVDVTWALVTGATYYRVSRSDTATGPKTALGPWQSATTFSDTTAVPSTVYYYWVQAAADATGTRASTYGGPDAGSRAGGGPQPLAAPTGVAASDGTFTDKVRVTWNAVSGASDYLVSRADSLTGPKTMLGTWQMGTTFDDVSATTQTTFYYWVQAAADASGTQASAYSTPDSGWRQALNALNPPTGLVASDGALDGLVRVRWDAVTSATHYRLYRAESVDGDKTALTDWVTSTSYADASVTNDTVYYYWARAAVDAAGDQASYFSAPDTGWAGVERLIKIAYKGCTVAVHDINSLTVGGANEKSSVQATWVKKPPKDTAPTSGTLYLTSAALGDVSVAGALGKFSTQAAVAHLTATGPLDSVSATGCSIDAMTGAGFKTVKMAAAPDSTRTDHPKRLWTRIESNDTSAPATLVAASVSLTGIGLQALDLPGESVTVKVASKVGKIKGGASFVSLADVSGDGVRAGATVSLTLTGGNLLSPVTAAGSIHSLSVKSMKATVGTLPVLLGGFVGSPSAFPTSSTALSNDPAAYDVRLCAGEAGWLAQHPPKGTQPPAVIGTLSASQGILAYTMAGYTVGADGLPVLGAPTFAGAVSSIKTPAPGGTALGLWGVACVHTNTVIRVTGDTNAAQAGRFTVVTGP